MKFQKLHEMIPYAKGGKAKILTMNPYNAITLAMPGRHAQDTVPVGGDFVVMVDDENMDWTRHQFTHTDLFNDLESKRENDGVLSLALGAWYLKVIHKGDDPEKIRIPDDVEYTGIHPQTFLYAVQALAVAEHRRYHMHEAKFGGRYLPFRFAAGIIEGQWTAAQAAEKQKFGRSAVERLEKVHGLPVLTKELMA